jgi:hypothetical protein
MTTYNFTITMKTDEPTEELTIEEFTEIVNHLMELNQWASVEITL